MISLIQYIVFIYKNQLYFHKQEKYFGIYRGTDKYQKDTRKIREKIPKKIEKYRISLENLTI